MSKIETLRHLPTPADVRQSVQALGQMLAETSERLDKTARQVQSLEQLPDLVADQVSEAMKALDPVLSMRQDVLKSLEAFDQIAAVQRETLESLAQELSNRATSSMQEKTALLVTVLESVTEKTDTLLMGLKVSMNSMTKAVGTIQNLPAQLTTDLSGSVTDLNTAAAELKTAGMELKKQTDRAKSRPRWKAFAELTAVAVLAAMLVLVGQVGLSKILPPGDAQLWTKATEKERLSLNQIASRPEK